jgi:hypothetical protein
VYRRAWRLSRAALSTMTMGLVSTHRLSPGTAGNLIGSAFSARCVGHASYLKRVKFSELLKSI